MDNLVGIIGRHTGNGATLSTLLEKVNIVVVTLESKDKRVCGKRSKVFVYTVFFFCQHNSDRAVSFYAYLIHKETLIHLP